MRLQRKLKIGPRRGGAGWECQRCLPPSFLPGDKRNTRWGRRRSCEGPNKTEAQAFASDLSGQDRAPARSPSLLPTQSGSVHTHAHHKHSVHPGICCPR